MFFFVTMIHSMIQGAMAGYENFTPTKTEGAMYTFVLIFLLSPKKVNTVSFTFE